MNDGLRKKTQSAIFWNGINQFGKTTSLFVVTIILARLLSPADFGLIAMILVITRFGDIFIDSGFRLGIVQQKEIGQAELSTVFYINIIIGLLFCLIVFFGAPLMGMLYSEPRLVPLTRAISFVYFFSSFSIVQHGLMIRDMDFKKRTIAQLVGQMVAGIVAIVFAYIGFGVWSLVVNMLLQAILSTFLYWVQTDWRPALIFKLSSIKKLTKFSGNLLGVTILGNIAGRTDVFLAGKLFSPLTLGLYSKSKDFALLPAGIGSEVISTSLFPALAKIQDEKERFKAIYLHVLKIIIFLFAPFSLLMALCSKELIRILLGSKWIGAIIYFKLFFIMVFFYVINGFLIYVINAKGRSELNLKKELIQAPVRIVMLVLIAIFLKPLELKYFIYFLILFFILSNIYSQFLISKICEINFLTNCSTGLRFVFLAVLSFIIVKAMPVNFSNEWLALLVKSFLFLGFYFGVLALIKDRIFSGLYSNMLLKSKELFLRINK